MRYELIAALALLGAVGPGGTEEPPLTAKPMWQRLLQGEDATKAVDLAKRIDEHAAADRYAEAIRAAEELLALRRRVQGADHWEVVYATADLEALRKVAALSADQRAGWRKSLAAEEEADRLQGKGQYVPAMPLRQQRLQWCRQVLGERHPDTATSYNNVALSLYDQGKYAEAAPLYQKALDLRRTLLGERHPFTAQSYNNLAANLDSQDRHAEAATLYRMALDIDRDVLGERHAATAASYNNLAHNLNAQGKHNEAAVLYQKALDIRRALLGERHRDTANSYNNLAFTLNAQGQYAEAAPLFRKALDLNRALLGERHPSTANSYNNLAANLGAQGRHAEAAPLYQKALDLNRDLLGEHHPKTAISYANVAANLDAQGRYAEAATLYQKALDIDRDVLGERHSDTAGVYSYMACNLDAQGLYAEAAPFHQKALDIRRDLLGEHHRKTANSYTNVADNLSAQGRHAEAAPLYQKALDIRRDALGERHPATVTSYGNSAYNLCARGEYADAFSTFQIAALGYEAARLAANRSGGERAAEDRISPYTWLAAAAAHEGRYVEAHAALETGLGRGLLDEMATARGTALTAEEEQGRRELAGRSARLEPRILKLVMSANPSDMEKAELQRLIAERSEIEAKLTDLGVALSRREVATTTAIQAALPADAALVAWADEADNFGGVQEHWACVLHPAGPPIWERLPGTGPQQQWTKDDDSLLRHFRDAVAAGSPAGEIDGLARQLQTQRLVPVEKHLAGVKRLIVVPAERMAGVPVEVLTDRFTVSYVPSGTVLAKLKDRPRPAGPATLLALGDPAFDVPGRDRRPAPTRLPPGGLLVLQVVPGGNAATARIQPGDVLLAYAGTEVTSVEQLGQLIAPHAGDKTVTVKIWRETEDHPAVRELAPGKLGVVLDKQAAPEAVAAKRKTDQMLAKLRGGDWAELPGTRIELARLRKLFGDRATVLTGSDASEQALTDLRAGGKLQSYRYLHFATHGETNDAMAFESALILAQDHLPDPTRRKEGEPFVDGKLSARKVLEDWKLDAELVTLSACESGLGREGGGDGLLGFAQAFLRAGARSVCLSLWKVDDAATALLMDRFYANLVTRKLPKAEALAEAKAWLRELSADDAAKLTAELTNGVARGKGAEPLKLVVPAPDAAAAGGKPFAHPRYWAGFILIGDPI